MALVNRQTQSVVREVRFMTARKASRNAKQIHASPLPTQTYAVKLLILLVGLHHFPIAQPAWL